MNLQDPVTAIFFIFIAAILLNIVSYVLNKYLVYTPDYIEKRRMIAELRKEYNELKKTAKGDSKQLKKMEQKLKSIQKMESQLMVKSFRPMILIMVLFGLFWWWLAQIYGNMGSFVYSPVPLPIIGVSMNFFWWYFICSLAVGAVIRRFLYPKV
jgi:uncharacterized membrane protein (DUF106 family)